MGCLACRDRRMAENKVKGCRDLHCWKLLVAVGGAVFNHTHLHAHTEATAEVSVFRENSRLEIGLGASLPGFRLEL